MTKIDSAFRNPRSAILPLLFAAVVVFIHFYGLTIPLLGPDEPRYSQVAREMFERGDWITPTLGGFHWFEKPALLYWLQIAAYKLFGVNEFAARFGSVLFGFGTTASLWILGRNISEKKERHKDNGFSRWLALLAASSIGIIVFSRGASFDIILTFPMTAALVSFYIFDSWEQRHTAAGDSDRLRRRYAPLFSFYFFIGVALLAKGLIGIVFPFAIVGFYCLLSRRFPSRFFILSLIWGIIISASVAAMWYLPMYQRYGWEFIDEFFIQHHFQRYTSNKYFHPQPFYFFFWVLPLMTIPWLPFFLGGIWQSVKSAFIRGDAETRREEERSDVISGSIHEITSLHQFTAAWLLVPIVFFSFSGSKLPGYILPALPPAMILAAVYVTRFVNKSELRSRMILGIALATFVVVAALLSWVVPRFAEGDSVKGLVAAANESGYRSENILTLHTISHNAEFYAAGRLLRDAAGRQRRLLGPTEVLDEIRKNNGEPALVLIPVEYLRHLTDSPLMKSNVLKDNGELAIVYVEAK